MPIMPSASHEFSYSVSPQPWVGAQTFAPYSPADSAGIAEGVLRVCLTAQERALMVPVRRADAAELYYYVAVVREDPCSVNVVQARLDFSGAENVVLRARPVRVPDSVRRLLPAFVTFESRIPSSSTVAALFWDVLSEECAARCGDAVIGLPARSLELPGVNQSPPGGDHPALGVFHYGGRHCFAATVYEQHRRNYFIGEWPILQTLCAVLQEAAASSLAGAPFARLVPQCDGHGGSPSGTHVSQREYLAVVRGAGSSDTINVVYFNGRMRQHKVVFLSPGGLPLPGFTIVSRRLDALGDRNALWQAPVLARWSRPLNQIVPVGGSLSSIPLPRQRFAFMHHADAGTVRYNARACERIQLALSHVCHVGGPTRALVPVDDSLPPRGAGPVSFVYIHRSLRTVRICDLVLFGRGHEVSIGSVSIVPREFARTLPHMEFDRSRHLFLAFSAHLYLNGVLRAVWDRRIDALLLADAAAHPLAPMQGGTAVFEYVIGYRMARLSPGSSARLEWVLRFVAAAGLGASLLVSLSADGEDLFAAVVRDVRPQTGDAILVGMVHGPLGMRLHNLWSSNLQLPCVRYMPQMTSLELTRGQLRDLYEEPLFDHWQQASAINPHDMPRRCLPFCLAVRGVLDVEIIDMILRMSFE